MQILIKDLKKAYNGKLILDIDRLEIKKGEITGIMGPNGTGKTTLLNIIAGLDGFFSGSIKYDHKPLDRVLRLQITMIFQKVSLFNRTVFDNIDYPLKIRGAKKAVRNSKINDIMTKIGITDLKHKKCHYLSGGEMQKVALARAIVFSPRLLLLDEPASNLDAKSVSVFLNQVKDYNIRTGSTVVFVTHNREHAKRLCSEVLFIKKGKIGPE